MLNELHIDIFDNQSDNILCKTYKLNDLLCLSDEQQKFVDALSKYDLETCSVIANTMTSEAFFNFSKHLENIGLVEIKDYRGGDRNSFDFEICLK